MTAKKNNLIGLAKGTDTKVNAPTKKTTEKKVVEKVLTPEEERNFKARETVEKLLHDVDLAPVKKQDELLEIDNDVEENKSDNWLEEQVSRLSEENEKLKSEVALAKEDYSKIFIDFQQLKGGIVLSDNNTELKAKIIQLFNEIQANLISMGVNPNTNQPYFEIYPVAFLNRLIMFFPFLQGEKKF